MPGFPCALGRCPVRRRCVDWSPVTSTTETQMKTFFEYLPLVALLSPVMVVVAMNVALKLAGEKGTLLFPGSGILPEVTMPSAHFFPQRDEPVEEQEMPEPEYRKAA